QLEEAVSIQKTEGGRLLKILTDKQFVTEQDMAFSTGRCLNTPPINLAKLHVPEEVMALVPRDMAKTNKLVPIARLNGKLFVAMADPTNVLAVDDLKRLVQPLKEKASDIHIEPFQNTLKLRYRIDGELVAAESPPKALQLAITSRIKILAALNIAERRVPQDGRFRIKVAGKEIDLRISF